ncbi:hypothetical protein D3C78_1596680 [compost metagenome]
MKATTAGIASVTERSSCWLSSTSCSVRLRSVTSRMKALNSRCAPLPLVLMVISTISSLPSLRRAGNSTRWLITGPWPLSRKRAMPW